LGENVARDEGLVLDYQRDPDEIGKQPGIDQPDSPAREARISRPSDERKLSFAAVSYRTPP
jgi:hypothetical protein